jgi:hypothetical protein
VLEFVFASAFDAMNIPSGSININLIDEFLQVVLKEDPVGYSSNQEIHRYIDGDLMDLLYRIGLKTATAVAFWSRMVASYAAINSNQSPLKIAELFFGRPLV